MCIRFKQLPFCTRSSCMQVPGARYLFQVEALSEVKRAYIWEFPWHGSPANPGLLSSSMMKDGVSPLSIHKGSLVTLCLKSRDLDLACSCGCPTIVMDPKINSFHSKSVSEVLCFSFRFSSTTVWDCSLTWSRTRWLSLPTHLHGVAMGGLLQEGTKKNQSSIKIIK